MSTFYIKNEQISGDKIQIVAEDYYHLKNVLRCKVGENLDICDENANRYKTEIIEITDKMIVCIIKSIDEKTTENSLVIDLYQGLPKSDKLELIIQKTTELGINNIIPVEMTRSVVKIEEKNIDKKLDRWNKICSEAAKQCGRQRVPKVHKSIYFKNIIENISKYDIVLLPYENEKSATIKEAIIKLKGRGKIENIAVIIGPEGGFSKDEVSILSRFENVHVVTLGPRILRTETAGIAVLSMLMYEFEL